MKPAFWSRRLHKWLGLLLAVQLLLWMASGVYMTSISIDVIHGDHLSQVERAPLAAAATLTPAQLAAQFPGMTGFRLKQLLGAPVYEVRHPGGSALVDARSGTRLDPLDQARARQLAQAAYLGEGRLARIELLQQLPQEVGARQGPLWRADFDDQVSSSLYVSPASGEVVATRHALWRAFDFLWMLHIMDYATRSDINNTLLRVAAALGTLFGLSGLWLLWFVLRKRRAA